MAISIDWGNTFVISVPQADLTLVSGTLYELDTDQFRLDLKALEESEDGMPFTKTHVHNTAVTVAGTTFARTVEILPPYSVTFEDTGSAYSVRLVGSNNNIFDVDNGILNPTDKVTVISTNSAGLIQISTGSGLSTEQATQLSEVHQDMGLKSGSPVTITENTPDTSYDQDSTGISKEIRTSGSTKTVTRT